MCIFQLRTQSQIAGNSKFYQVIILYIIFRFINSQVSAAHLNFWLEELNQGFFLIRYFQFIVDFDIILG